VFIASGSGIAPGRLDREVSILDFAPTFCDALGVDCDEFDGIAIPEIAEPMKVRLAPARVSVRPASQPQLPA
jgi:arylsulfatase A-like enzyme